MKAAANAPRDVDFATEGWLAPGATELEGPFAHAYTDINDDNVAQPAEEVPPSSGDDFLYPFTAFAAAAGLERRLPVHAAAAAGLGGAAR